MKLSAMRLDALVKADPGVFTRDANVDEVEEESEQSEKDENKESETCSAQPFHSTSS